MMIGDAEDENKNDNDDNHNDHDHDYDGDESNKKSHSCCPIARMVKMMMTMMDQLIM